MVPDGGTSFVEGDWSGREGRTASIWKPCKVVGIFVARLPRLGSDGVRCGEVVSKIGVRVCMQSGVCVCSYWSSLARVGV